MRRAGDLRCRLRALHVEVPAVSLAVSLAELREASSECTAAVAERIAGGHRRQHHRFGQASDTPTYATSEGNDRPRYYWPDTRAQALLDAAFEPLHLSVRAVTRLLKVARTIADLAASDAIQCIHVAKAMQYRSLDRRIE